MNATLEVHIHTEQAMLDLGAALTRVCKPGMVLFLQGDLGAGKTTLVRGFLNALGHAGFIKSPSYALVEPYAFEDKTVYHLDLYRLHDPHELEFLGVRDCVGPESICLVEWPEKALEALPHATLTCAIEHKEGDKRLVRLLADKQLIKQLSNELEHA